MAQYTSIEPIELTDDELKAVAGGGVTLGGASTNGANSAVSNSGNVGAISNAFNGNNSFNA
jgi:hypothetical protein